MGSSDAELNQPRRWRLPANKSLVFYDGTLDGRFLSLSACLHIWPGVIDGQINVFVENKMRIRMVSSQRPSFSSKMVCEG